MGKITGYSALTLPTTDDLLVVVDDPSGTPTTKKVTIANLFKTLGLSFGVGTAALAPIAMDPTSALLTTPVAGAFEADSQDFYNTLDTTNGRRAINAQHYFRIAANLGTRGGTIADYFDANSAIPTVTNGIYEIEWDLYFLKTTAGTLTFTITNTQTYTNLVAAWRGCVISGISASGAMSEAAVVTQTTAANALPVTGTLANGSNHHYTVRALAECGTAGNIRLRVTAGAGTITPLRGSMVTARRISSSNVGTYVA